MLDHVAALMGSNRCSRDAPLAVDCFAEVDGLGLGIVMVGELPGDACDLDVCDAVVL